MKGKRSFCISIFLVVLIVGSMVGVWIYRSSSKIISEELSNTLNEFVKFIRYSPAGNVEFVEEYRLTDKLLQKDDTKEIWELQRANKEDFIGKNIKVYKFKVGSNDFGGMEEAKLKDLYLMMSDGSIFGGYCLKDKTKYSIDGLTLDKLKLEKELMPIVKVKSTKKEDIAKEAFRAYIEANKTNRHYIELNKQLIEKEGGSLTPHDTYTEYSIGTIQLDNRKLDFFVADVSFDIKMTSDSGEWIAGNGELADDNWIRKKCSFADIMKVGENKYVILDLYTG